MNVATRARRRAAAEPHPQQLRELLIVLAHELFPDAREVALAVDNGLGPDAKNSWSGIRVNRVPRRHRWPARPRAFQTRRRIGKLVAAIFGDHARAGAVFYRGDRTKPDDLIGAVSIPLPGRPESNARELLAREGGAS